jgi:hypothetical protein
MTLPVVFTANGQTAPYNLTKSLRFRSTASANLSRTFTSSNRQIWTWSAWVKLGISQYEAMFSAYTGSGGTDSNFMAISFSTNQLQISGYSTVYKKTTQVFRDPSAWYHIVVAVDTTQATGSNRIKFYVNGTQITAFATTNDPAQNSNLGINGNYGHTISRETGFGSYFDGYQAEINFIDGQQLTPSSFGSTNATTGVWQPLKYTGTYGTNGFYLPFTNTASTSTLGNDFSGNSNTWTVNNISLTAGVTYDSMIDVPTLTDATTANYAVLNPLTPTYGSTLSNGNLTTSGPSGLYSTIAFPSTSSWYVELNTTTVVGLANGFVFGIATEDFSLYTWIRASANQVTTNLGTVTFNSYSNFASGNTAAIAYNASTGVVSYYKNNTLAGTVTGFLPTKPVFIYVGGDDASDVLNANFGQRPFTYTPPTGFIALNTYNLPTSTIVKGNTYMDATTYTGTGASQTITNGGSFAPSFVWMKSRSNATDNTLVDVLRGSTPPYRLRSNSTAAELTTSDGVNSFASTGINLDGTGSGGDVNTSTRTYVAWQWAGTQSGTSNTSGSITSTVAANTTSGFSVVTYTGNGVAATVGHGLGVAPSMIIAKSRSQTGENWEVQHTSLANTQTIRLNSTAAVRTSADYNNTFPTSSVFSLGAFTGINNNGSTYVAYCFAQIAGFSKFGSYTGGGNTGASTPNADGPFIYLGFRPKFVLIKRTSSAAQWVIYDSVRGTYNANLPWLYPNASDAETSTEAIDLLSNGFKIRSESGATMYPDGATFIYMAFAENPFKNSLAR